MAKVYSAGGIVFYIDEAENIPYFLIVKRFALSKKIEWIAPKGKIQEGETQEIAALREIHEETGLDLHKLSAKRKLDTLSLKLYNNDGKIGVDKDITYFLVEHSGAPDEVDVQEGEGFTGEYKRADIVNILNLVTYRDLRELYRIAYQAIDDLKVKDHFLENL